jgi:crossover junction endodeoxyribonuclease RusA
VTADAFTQLSAIADPQTLRPGTDPHSRPAGEAITYTVALPAGLPLLNANRSRREHWATVRRTAKAIREAAHVVARSQRIPLIERARIVYVIHPTPQTRKRDPGNWAESAKAAVDGLVDAGLFEDDNSQHVVGPDPRLGEPVKGGQLVLHIEVLVGGAS